MDTIITAETVYTSRTTTREQWHAERRSRGLRAIEEQARMQYASVRRTVYPLPMPTTCDLWWQHFNVRCGHTRHRLYLHLMERRTADRTRRLLSLLEVIAVLTDRIVERLHAADLQDRIDRAHRHNKE